MIEKCKNRLSICLNILINYGKYKKLLGKNVEIIKNDGLAQYTKLIGKTGYVSDFEFYNFKNPIIISFCKNNKIERYCFSPKEIYFNNFSECAKFEHFKESFENGQLSILTKEKFYIESFKIGE